MEKQQTLTGFVSGVTSSSKSNYKDILHHKYVRILSSMYFACSLYWLNGGMCSLPFVSVDQVHHKISFEFDGIQNIHLFKQCIMLRCSTYKYAVVENNKTNIVTIIF